MWRWRFVKSFDGLIFADSELNKGTVITVYFPVCKSRQSQQEHKNTEIIRGRGDEHILFVDDEKSILSFMQEAFSDYGYQATFYSNGTDALQDLQNRPNKFNLLVTDLNMPKMTGTELIEKARLINPNLQTILCSGYSKSIDRDKALINGINEFVDKPYQMDKLAFTIRKVLDETKKILP